MRVSSILRISDRTLVCAALASLVFFSRAWLIRVWGSPLPFWDQWDAEAVHLFRPWLDETLRWSDLFAPQNEHHIVVTQMANLSLFVACGRWDVWWELLLNALLHASIAAGLSYFFWSALTGGARVIGLLHLAVLFTTPSGWQNALWGFQSQVYFCIGFSFLALGGLLTNKPFHRRWWYGWGAALVALVTQASGILAAMSAFLISGLSLLITQISSSNSLQLENFPQKGRARVRRGTLGLLAVLIIGLVGWVLRAEAPQHTPMHARSVAQFAAVFARSLSWPWVNSGWIWLIMQSPVLWFAGNIIRKRRPLSTAEQLALGLILLTWLHAAAVAYSRGAGLMEARPLSRYQDPLLLGAAGNFFLLLRHALSARFGRAGIFFWSGTLLVGIIVLATTNFSLNLPYKRAQDTASLEQVRAYLASHDATVFVRDPAFPGPHPDSRIVRKVLDDQLLRPSLPAEMFDSSVRPPWLIRYSPWLALVSAAGFLVIAFCSGREKTDHSSTR